ncbi:MAG: hypothetical protein V4642_12970 [Bacteroidota bacterium]
MVATVLRAVVTFDLAVAAGVVVFFFGAAFLAGEADFAAVFFAAGFEVDLEAAGLAAVVFFGAAAFFAAGFFLVATAESDSAFFAMAFLTPF